MRSAASLPCSSLQAFGSVGLDSWNPADRYIYIKLLFLNYVVAVNECRDRAMYITPQLYVEFGRLFSLLPESLLPNFGASRNQPLSGKSVRKSTYKKEWPYHSNGSSGPGRQWNHLVPYARFFRITYIPAYLILLRT